MKQAIKSAKDARAAIGKKVHWVERTGGRGRLEWERDRSGILEDVKGKNVLISGNWEWRPDLTELHLED